MPLLSTTIIGGKGVEFTESASPPNLPGFNFAAAFSADSAPPVVANGVNPGEFLNIIFEGDWSDIIAALQNSLFIVGIHVQGFDGGGSESFVNSVPDADIMILLGPALLGLGLLGRRRSERTR